MVVRPDPFGGSLVGHVPRMGSPKVSGLNYAKNGLAQGSAMPIRHMRDHR